MRIMRLHEAFPVYGSIHLFCNANLLQNKYLGIHFAVFASYILIILILLGRCTNCLWNRHKNMRIMRMYEGRSFKENICLVYKEMGCPNPKHEADMREHEDGGAQWVG